MRNCRDVELRRRRVATAGGFRVSGRRWLRSAAAGRDVSRCPGL